MLLNAIGGQRKILTHVGDMLELHRQYRNLATDYIMVGLFAIYFGHYVLAHRLYGRSPTMVVDSDSLPREIVNEADSYKRKEKACVFLSDLGARVILANKQRDK